MRLGAQPCHLVPGTKAAAAYGEPVVYERHRHRWEVNPAYHERLERGRARALGQLPQRASRPRSSSCPTIRSSSPGSSTPSCGRGPPGRTRSSATSSARRRCIDRTRAERSLVDHRLGASVPEPLRARIAYEGRYVRVDVEEWPGLEPMGDRAPPRRHRGAAGHARRRRGARAAVPAGGAPGADRGARRASSTSTGEDALTGAARELFEETGYPPRRDRVPRRGLPHGGLERRVRPRVLGSHRGGAGRRVEAGIELVREPLGRMVDAARSGRVRDAKTALALLMAAGPPLPLPGGAARDPDRALGTLGPDGGRHARERRRGGARRAPGVDRRHPEGSQGQRVPRRGDARGRARARARGASRRGAGVGAATARRSTTTSSWPPGREILPDADAVFAAADMIVKVKEPQPQEYERFREGQVLFTYLHLAADERAHPVPRRSAG